MPDTVRSIAEIVALIADNATGNISAQDLRDLLVSLDDTGWAQYGDTQYTAGSPFLVTAGVDTIMPNNGSAVIEEQKPRDITTMLSAGKILGLNGDSYNITIDCKALPTSAGTTLLEFWFDIGGTVGELYRRPVTFPKGNGIVRPIVFTTGIYSKDTWEANGATVYVRSDGPVSIYDIRYVITRLHRGSRKV